MREITIPRAWLERLKYYRDKVESNGAAILDERELAISTLLAYLESLEYLLSETNK